MKKLLIAILLLVFIGAYSQDYHFQPEDYPVDKEMSLKYVPVASSDVEYGSALPTWWERNKKGLAITGIQVASVVLDATGDAIYDTGKESGNDSKMFWGHTLQASAIGVMGVSLASLAWRGSVWDGVRFGVSWVAMRYAIHDLSYNLARGIDPLYADGIKAKMSPDGRAFTQIIALTFSVSFNICEF